MTTEEIQTLHAKVWAFRAELADVWPTPPPLDAAAFAVTEAGEAIDAELRTRGGYARNNAKEPDLFGEMADWALMLLTTLGPDYEIDHWATHVMSDLPAMNYDTALVYWSLSVGDYKVDSNITGILHAIAAYPGMDLAAELDKRMKRIRSKHLPTAG
jgi:hypothetical protein